MSVRIASPRRSSPIDNIVNNLRIFVNLENTEENRGLKGKWTARYHRQKPRPLKVKSSQVKASYERMINYFTSFFFFINPPRNTGVQHGRHWPEIERRFTRRTCPSVRHVRGGDRPGRCAPHISTIGIARSFPGDGIHERRVIQLVRINRLALRTVPDSRGYFRGHFRVCVMSAFSFLFLLFHGRREEERKNRSIGS